MSKRIVALGLLLGVGLVLGGGFLLSDTSPEKQAQRDELVDRFPALPADEEAILFAGDTLWTRDYRPFTKEHGLDYPAQAVMPLVASAQAVAFVGNLEGPITKERKRCPPKKNWNYRSRPRDRKVLPKIGFTHLSLANNHALDRCAKGMNDTRNYLTELGILSFGAGDTFEEAIKPAVIEIGGIRVAVVGGMESWRHYREADWGATDERAGVFLMSKKDIPRALQTARNDADAVVAFAHWGSNYRPVSKAQRRIAGRLINGGADLVIGHHGHMAQQFGMYKGKPTVWGLGNFLFGTPGRFGHDKMQPGYGLLVRLVVKDQTLNRLELIPIMLNNRLTEFQPRLCTVSESEEVLRSLITKGDDNITVRDGVAIFPL
jgi:poly-gamma-glutamate capsule biosynthesis protein CapA/YwtB (metallophosphatase superfamily)